MDKHIIIVISPPISQSAFDATHSALSLYSPQAPVQRCPLCPPGRGQGCTWPCRPGGWWDWPPPSPVLPTPTRSTYLQTTHSVGYLNRLLLPSFLIISNLLFYFCPTSQIRERPKFLYYLTEIEQNFSQSLLISTENVHVLNILNAQETPILLLLKASGEVECSRIRATV